MPRVFSGMQATGTGQPHIGNYFGAIKNWAVLQENNDCLFCVVDLHSITAPHEREKFAENARSLFASYIAAGLDPVKHTLYFQSHVPEHSELAWLLMCHSYMGELSRMTQFKDKSKSQENISAGLFAYPVLMAADILLFQTDIVPVGDDQKQHLELTRDIAIRMNNKYGELFKIPEPYIPEVGARIMSLLHPQKKMSKSCESEQEIIYILDNEATVNKKFKRAVTDSSGEIKYAPIERPGVSNLLSIYACVLGINIKEAEKRFEGSGYGVLKTETAAAVNAFLAPIQKRYYDLIADPAQLNELITKNAERARALAAPNLKKVKQSIGFLLEN